MLDLAHSVSKFCVAIKRNDSFIIVGSITFDQIKFLHTRESIVKFKNGKDL